MIFYQFESSYLVQATTGWRVTASKLELRRSAFRRRCSKREWLITSDEKRIEFLEDICHFLYYFYYVLECLSILKQLEFKVKKKKSGTTLSTFFSDRSYLFWNSWKNIANLDLELDYFPLDYFFFSKNQFFVT